MEGKEEIDGEGVYQRFFGESRMPGAIKLLALKKSRGDGLQSCSEEDMRI